VSAALPAVIGTQLIRLGGPNFHEIPINRPVAPGHNNQRDGHMRQTINVSRTSYEPNTLGGGCPMQAGRDLGGLVSYGARIDAVKERLRGEKFFDHFSQATLFWNSQSAPEKEHIVDASGSSSARSRRRPCRSAWCACSSTCTQGSRAAWLRNSA
jgi:catalase